MAWYYAVENERQGPVDDAEFAALVAQGRIQPRTLVWSPGMANWQPYAELAPQQPDAVPRPLPPGEPADAPSRPVFRYAGFWIRFGALIVDSTIMSLLDLLAILLLSLTQAGLWEFFNSPLYTVTQLLLPALYYALFVGRYGATPGKMTFGLTIIRADGARVTYLRALARYFATIISSLVLCIGYLMAAIDTEEHRALHDQICDTRVIFK